MTTFDREKYKNLIHHVAWQIKDRDGWGLTKLFKVLWFFEARRYSLHNEVFSGATYQRDEFGPRPRAVYLMLDEMEAEGLLSIQHSRMYNRTAKRPVALRPPKPGLLNESQAKDLSFWIDYVGGSTATAISDESHDYGWEITPQGEDIPLYAILAERVRAPEGEELDWAKRRAKELGLP